MSQRVSVSVDERYRLERLWGKGGMGAVYQARDRLTDQHVALKLVPVDPAARGVLKFLTRGPGGP